MFNTDIIYARTFGIACMTIFLLFITIKLFAHPNHNSSQRAVSNTPSERLFRSKPTIPQSPNCRITSELYPNPYAVYRENSR